MSPNRVISKTKVKGPVRKKRAWSLISNYEAYPHSIPCINEVITLERTQTRGKSEWSVTIGEVIFNWVQNDYFDEEDYRIRFEALTGLLSPYSGCWKVCDRKKGGIIIQLEIHYYLDIPVIQHNIGDVLSEKMQAYADILTNSVRSKLENLASEQRKHPRTAIRTFNDIRVEDRFIRSFVTDISAGGIAFYYHSGFDGIGNKLYLGSLSLPVKDFNNSASDNSCRVVFSRPLLDEELLMAINRLRKTNVRRHHRHIIGKNFVFRSKSGQFAARLVDVSEGGMQLHGKHGMQKLGDFIEIKGKQISIRKQIHDHAHQSTRIIFTRSLSLDEFLQFIRKPA